MLQSFLRQILSNHILIQYFSLNCKPRLEPILYQRLKEWVQIEDTLIVDNKEELELAIEKEIK